MLMSTTDVLAVQVFMLSGDAVLNVDTLSELLASGHSRVPVHMPGNRCAVISHPLMFLLVQHVSCPLTGDLLYITHAMKQHVERAGVSDLLRFTENAYYTCCSTTCAVYRALVTTQDASCFRKR